MKRIEKKSVTGLWWNRTEATVVSFFLISWNISMLCPNLLDFRLSVRKRLQRHEETFNHP